MSRRALGVAAVAAAAVLAAGCGGSDDSSGSDTTATATWADGLCSAISTWKTSITSIGSSLKDGDLSKDSLTSAVDDAKSATDTLSSDLESLGKPDTDAGQQAKESVDQLSTDLQADVTKIQDAVDGVSGVSGVVSAVSVISSTLVTAGDQVTSTISDLKGLDAKGEISDAFQQSSSCNDLTG